MIDLRSLEVFYWVVKLGGFGRAAERLQLTQPAVSGRVRQIEDRFNTRLLDRGFHGAPVLTPKGSEVYAYAERMLSLSSELVSRLAQPADFQGTVRLGTAETLVHTLLGNLIRRLHQDYPGVTPEITVDISPDLQSMLLNGELDVALLLGPLNEPRVRNVALRDYELVWVASPDLPIGTGANGTGRLSLADLVRWPILCYPRRTLPHAQLAELFNSPDLPPARLFANSSLASIVRMAADGIGIGILPRAVVDRELAEGRLRLLTTDVAMPPLHFTASYLATPGTALGEVVAKLAGQVARTP
jgi:DNA-binding transcriptional LysR family regulator